MKLKLSYYTQAIENDEGIILHHLSDRKKVFISKTMFENINKYINGIFECDTDTKKAIAQLFAYGFIIKDEISEEDEIENYLQIKNNRYAAKISEGVLYFLPTLDCNLRCTYCVIGTEICKSNNKKMSDECISKTVEFLINDKCFSKLSNLSVVLFGGEPSLAVEQNIKFMRLLNKKMGEEKTIVYALVSNGYEWSEKDFDELILNGLSSIQITLDGPPEIHNNRRISKYGEGTFDIIFKNIEMMIKREISIIIRINVDTNNYLYVDELLELLSKKEFQHRVALQLAPVDPSDYCDTNGYDMAVLKGFDKIYKKAFKLGFNVFEWSRGCSSEMDGFLAISPNGDLYKCPSFVGKSNRIIGNVYSGYNEKYIDSLNKELSVRCKRCKYLSYCNGGCQAMLESEGVDGTFCFLEANQAIIDSYLKHKYNYNGEILQANRIKDIIRKSM